MNSHRLCLIVMASASLRSRVRDLVVAELPDVAVLEASTAAEAVVLAGAASCALVLVDLRLPDRSGIAVLPALRARQPAAVIVALANLPEEQFAPPALRAGATACVPLERIHEELVPLLSRVPTPEAPLAAAPPPGPASPPSLPPALR